MNLDLFNLSNIRSKNEETMEIKEIEVKDIAIVGVSAQMPMAENIDEFWENLKNKLECVGKFPKERQKHTDAYLKYKGTPAEDLEYYDAAFLDRIDMFDPKMFHLSPMEAKLMEPKQRLFLQHAWRAIEDAGYVPEELKGRRIGVYSGFSDFGDETYFDILTEVQPDSIDIGVSGNFQAIIPSRISYLLDFKGPSMVVDTACSSSLVAIHLACQALRNNECESALVGSVRLHLFPLRKGYRIGFESKDGRTKAFDDSATGTGVGEGAICIMLKPLEKAKADGNHIYATIKGTAINQDGNSVGITAPNADAQADVIERAWKDAGVTAEDITYMETHGTGTVLGDPIEIDGISKAFGKYTTKKQYCGIGSVKSNIGHLYEAAGLASVLKCIYSLNEKVLLPTINYNSPNKAIEFQNSPVYVNTKEREWMAEGKKRICGISSFGLSGTNCHIVLEEPEQVIQYEADTEKENYILTLSGKTESILKELAGKYLDDMDRIRKMDPKDVCYTAAVGRNHYSYRMAIIFSDYEQLKTELEQVLSDFGMPVQNSNVIYGNCINQESENRIQEPFITENQDDEYKNNESKDNDKHYDYKSPEQIGIRDLNQTNSYEHLMKLGSIYTNGIDISWTDLYSSMKRQRIQLPVHSFDQKSYWIDIPEVETAEKKKKAEKKADIQWIEAELKGRDDGEYTLTERKLGAIVRKIMGYDAVHISENFYDFGGDSILAINVNKAVNEQFGTKFSVAVIFSNPTIASLAKYIDEQLQLTSGSEKKENRVTKENKPNDDGDIAIIGMAGRFPMADNVNEYWNNLYQGKDCVGTISNHRKGDLKYYFRQLGYDENEVKLFPAGYMNQIDQFDYEYFGLSLKEATLMDPCQRGFLEVAYETMEEAGYGGDRMKGSNTGVFVGYTEDYSYSYRRFIYESDPSLTKTALAGNLASIIPGRVSYNFDLKGPSIAVDTACSSSLVALNMAIKSIRNGECDSAIVGGARIKLLPLIDEIGKVGVESEQYMIKAFDDEADGIAEGEAICAILLKPLKQAVADQDHIHGVIKGSAVNQDGTGMGVTAPRSETQTEVIIKAWKDANIDPTSISYVEAHGTGTKLGDLVEYEGLVKAFGQYTKEKQFCAIGSVKTNLGHTYQSSGIAGVIKAVLSMKNKKLLPSIHFENPNRLINFEDSPFYYNDIVRDWDTKGKVRRCGVSSFGLSGTNCHVVLEEYSDNKIDTKTNENTKTVSLFTPKRCWYIPRVKTAESKSNLLHFLDDSDYIKNDFELEEEAKNNLIADSEEENYEIIEGLNKVEQIVINAFKKAVGAKNVSMKDNFFERGGNSLKATQLVSEVYKNLEVLISINDILLYSTVGDLAVHIEQLLEHSGGVEDNHIVALPDREYYDLSVKQEELWLSSQIYEDHSSMNITLACLLHEFNLDTLNKALEAVLNRHPSIRTAIVKRDGEAKQVIRGAVDYTKVCTFKDISNTSNVKESMTELITEETKKVFDIENDVLVRTVIAKTSETSHLFVFTIHHIISDWWSVNIIMEDLKKYYIAFSKGEEPQLSALDIKYTDFAVWHRNRIGQNKEKLQLYWKERLKGPLPKLDMRTDYKRPEIKGQIGKKIDFSFESEMMQALKKHADAGQGTMFMALLSGVYTLLYKYSGQNDIVLGTNTSGREHPQLQNQVGYYINVLPLRLTVDGNDSYKKVFDNVKEAVLGAFEHQDYPFVMMLEDNQVSRDLSRAPVFDVMVQLIIDPTKDNAIGNGNARLEEIEYDSLESKYDLVFNFYERRGAISLELEYCNSLFKEETVQRMVQRLQEIFRQFSVNETTTVDELQMEQPKEQNNIPIRRKRR